MHLVHKDQEESENQKYITYFPDLLLEIFLQSEINQKKKHIFF